MDTSSLTTSFPYICPLLSLSITHTFSLNLRPSLSLSLSLSLTPHHSSPQFPFSLSLSLSLSLSRSHLQTLESNHSIKTPAKLINKRRDRTAYRSEQSMRPYIGDLLPPPSPPSAAAAAPPLTAGPRAAPPWGSSPMPYLFGGLAAMLGVIFLALLLLACSYWKLSGHLDSPAAAAADDDDGDRGGAASAEKPRAAAAEERGVVAIVMAGEKEPTFLGTPVDAMPNKDAGIYKRGAAEAKKGGEVTALGR